ncbi:MAG: alpha-N-acetylglucosaminidase TIM-barrel domain-containing protein, partial [Dermabacteraceae bacterium]
MCRDHTASFDGVRELVRRRAPDLADRLHFRHTPTERAGQTEPAAQGGRVEADQVIVGVSGGELSIEASSPSAAAVGLAHALESVIGADLSWDAAPVIEVPASLPDRAPQRLETALRLRYHLNPVTFGYTMAFWDWERWERHIDWM